MNQFSFHISQAALDFIRRKIARSGISNPVVLFVGEGVRRRLNPEVGRALRAGADEATLQELFVKFHGEEVARNEWGVASRVISRDEVPADSLVEVAGIPFVLWSSLAAKLNGGSIEYDDMRGFVLKDKDGGSVLPFDERQIAPLARGGPGS